MATRESVVSVPVAGNAEGGASVPEGPRSSHRTSTVRDPNQPRSFALDASGALRQDLTPRQMCDALAATDGQLWVDVDVTNRHQVAVLEKVFGFHPLAIEDTLSPNSRVKLEEYPGYLFMIIRGVRFCDDTSDDPYDLETFNLCFFLGANYLVTVHGEYSASIPGVLERVERAPDVLGRGVARLMHAIMDSAVDAYFPIIDQIDDFLNTLEDRVFVNFDQAALHDIFSVKRLVLTLRRHLSPQREVFNVLTNRPSALLTHDLQVYFRDIYDHVLRINDSLESYRELLSSTLDSYLTQVSNRLGLITKGLSVVATLSVPFVVVSGMWGMNFEVIPMATTPYGFWLMMGVQLGIGLALVALMKWRKWL